MEHFNFFSFIIGLLIGVIPIIMTINENKRKIVITPEINDSFEDIILNIVNMGKRRVNIKSIIIGYGRSNNNLKTIVEEKFEEKMLHDGKDFNVEFLRSNLILATKTKNISNDNAYGLLWGIIKLSTKEKFYCYIPINSNIIENKDYFRADEAYIAAEVFLGFPQRIAPIDPSPFLYPHHKSRAIS